MCAKTVRKPYRILSPEVWAEIRRQYIAGVSLAEICRRFGVPRSTLTTRRSTEDWDAQRQRCLAIRARLGESIERSSAPEADGTRGPGVPQSASGAPPVEQLSARTPAPIGAGVRNQQVGKAGGGPEILNDAYRDFVGVMHLLVEQLVSDASLAAATGARPSRSLLEAARALEKLQRVERAALGMDRRSGDGRDGGVIVLPAKLTMDEWLAKARGTHDEDDDELVG